MFPTRSYTESGHSTQLSWIRTHFIPRRAATAATWRVWLDWTPPIDTRVSHFCAMASATRYSSLRTLLPPKASPLLQSSRFSQLRAPPRCELSRSRGCTGDAPNRRGYRANESRFIVTPADSGLDRGCRDVDDLVSLRLPACHPVAEAVRVLLLVEEDPWRVVHDELPHLPVEGDALPLVHLLPHLLDQGVHARIGVGRVSEALWGDHSPAPS